MAGRRQHTVPRFLLNGFASKGKGEDVFVWLHHRGSTAREVNTKNVGVDIEFYGKPGPSSTDDKITNLESPFVALLDELRRHSQSTPVTGEQIPRLISHLSMRTRALRTSLVDSVDFLAEKLRNYLRNTDVLTTAILNDPRVLELVGAELKANGVGPDRKREALRIIRSKVSESFGMLFPDALETIDSIVDAAKSVFPAALRDSHIAALDRDPYAQKRAERYAGLHWFLLPVSAPLLLADVACVFETAGRRRFKPFDDLGDDVRKALLPISSDRLLVGTPLANCPAVDVWLVNKAAVRCSYEYFVSSSAIPNNSQLDATIGQWSGILDDKDLNTLVNELKVWWVRSAAN